MARNENPASILHPRVAAARRDFVSGRITRREMLFRASMAGAGAMTLAALGGLKVAAQATPEGSPAATGEVGYSIQVPTDLRTDLGGQSIRAVLADTTSTDIPWQNAAAAKFTEATGINVEIIPGEQSATDRLQNYRQQFAAQSSDLDVYQIDVIWPGIIAQFAVDMTPYITNASDFLPAIIENNTVDGKLVAVPWFTDAGLLYYRTDLLEKYGLELPTTWDDVTTAAQTIQEGERASTPTFTGFAWQGAAYEGLTCNGLEWQVANGGGFIVETDGTVSINNPQAIAAFERARGWVNSITPQGVVNWQELDTFNTFTTGSAAFARNWPYMYSASQAAGSTIVGKVGVSALPAGTGDGARPADCLGGWNMFVSSFSTKQDAAVEFMKYMTSAGVQRSFAIENSHTPTLTSVFDDPEVGQAQPFIADLRDIFTGGAVARPSTVTGENYADVSQAYYQQLNAILNGSVSAAEGAANMESDINTVLSGL